MPIAEQAVRDDEANALFHGLEGLRGSHPRRFRRPGLHGAAGARGALGESGSSARRNSSPSPSITACAPEAAREAAAVKRLARRLGVPHRTLRWRGRKPKTGLQEAARLARYRLLAQAAARAGYAHILTAHTLDDQAETVLFRLARGSGLVGLAGMAHAAPLPIGGRAAIFLVRPLLGIPKARLIATLKAARIAYSEDPSNRDPRFTRARLRALDAGAGARGLDARGLARLAARMRRAESTIEFAVGAARAALAPGRGRERGPVMFETARFATLPAEVAMRLLGRAIAHTGDEGPVELAKLEALYDSLRQAPFPAAPDACRSANYACRRLDYRRTRARRAGRIQPCARTATRRFTK